MKIGKLGIHKVIGFKAPGCERDKIMVKWDGEEVFKFNIPFQ